MKLPTSNKTASYGKRPQIRKGYYPMKLLKVEPFTDKDGKLKEGTYGHQLILSFAVYQGDQENGNKPVKPMFFQPKDDSNEQENVVLSKFVYYEYKAKNPKEGEPEYQTAITPNSAITKLFKCLGWEFSEEDVDPEEFIGAWVEGNVNDYSSGTGAEAYTASTIESIGPYEGPKIEETETKPTATPTNEAKEETSAEKSETDKKIAEIDSMKEKGLISDDAYKAAIESVKAQNTQ